MEKTTNKEIKPMIEAQVPAFTKPLTVKEAMDFLGYSRSYIYKLVHWKMIPCHKPTNGKLFFKRAELEEFCFRRKQFADYEIEEAAEAILNGGTKCKNIRQ
jgi:excisionase family DNA binding protein